jgi:hypothetical protein
MSSLTEDGVVRDIKTEIREFNWSGYGLDFLDSRVDPDLADEWAEDLAWRVAQVVFPWIGLA